MLVGGLKICEKHTGCGKGGGGVERWVICEGGDVPRGGGGGDLVSYQLYPDVCVDE